MAHPKTPPQASNPFGQLAALRDKLPPGAAVVDAPVGNIEKKEPTLFGAKLVVRHERKGHGGKTVTLVEGVLPKHVETLAGELKRALGCGARVEDGVIVVQGEHIARAIAFLEKKGAKKVIRGS